MLYMNDGESVLYPNEYSDISVLMLLSRVHVLPWRIYALLVEWCQGRSCLQFKGRNVFPLVDCFGVVSFVCF